MKADNEEMAAIIEDAMYMRIVMLINLLQDQFINVKLYQDNERYFLDIPCAFYHNQLKYLSGKIEQEFGKGKLIILRPNGKNTSIN